MKDALQYTQMKAALRIRNSLDYLEPNDDDVFFSSSSTFPHYEEWNRIEFPCTPQTPRVLRNQAGHTSIGKKK